MAFHHTVASPPSGVTAVWVGPTSIMVSWSPPSPMGGTSGYRIYYNRAGDSSDSVDVDGGNTNTHTLMGLTNGETYTTSIAGTSSTSGVLPSPPESAGLIALGKSKTSAVMEPIGHHTHATPIPNMYHVLVCVWELRVCYDSVPLL